jgi:release factor glutamine methyltransferase
LNLYSPLSELIPRLAKKLAERSDTPLLDAQLLVAHAAGQKRTWLLAHPEAALTSSQVDWIEQALLEIELGKPLPYILEAWEFFGLRFAVQSSVLIPRPETELLVEEALIWCRAPRQQHLGLIRAVDVGAGSGCIALSIAAHTPHTSWVASDISRKALQVARLNASAHGLQERVALLQADLLAPFRPDAFDLICANLPYIPSATLRKLPIFGREPLLALDGGPDGLDLIRLLIQQARDRLRPGGLLLVEIEASQGKAALEIAAQAFSGSGSRLLKDYAAHDRLLVVEKPG